ncbi:MAG: motility protein A [Acidobacteria bacterium 13_1_20CM_2_55_15]|nr:MAG: motility protein A [Acidobacteria bacterium 13_1_20CM_2_55_15]
MDLGTLLGIVLASAAILIGHAMEGGSILQILQPTAAMIVFGGTLGATMISFPMSVFKQAVADLLHIFKEDEIHPNEVIDQVIRFTNKARREGIISLEKEASAVKDDFFRKSLMMAIDGCEPKELRQTMELELQYIEERGEQSAKVYAAAGGYSPTIGIVGAVLGLIQVMQHLDNIDEVGKGIAVAFVATIYGVASANIFFLPAAGKLKFKHRKRIIVKEMMLEGTLGILEGQNPRLIEGRLTSFLDGEYQKLREQEAALRSRRKAA